MKIKNILKYLAEIPVVILVLLVLVPLGVLYFLYKILTMPFSYIRHKRSLYQKDFPCRYSLWRYPHHDEKVYTVIKKNDLPIAYIKGQKEYEQYEMPGYFVYKDILLDFNEPFFFDPERGLWLTELENQVGPLEKEAEKAKRGLAIYEEKKRADVSLWLFDTQKIKTDLQNADNAYRLAAAEYDRLKEHIETLEKQLLVQEQK